MFFVLLLAILASPGFEPAIERAFAAIQNNEWAGAASALDQALAEDSRVFAANNFHYLRGRIAENQREWGRAREEFQKIPAGNPLQPLAAWHAARASVRLQDDRAAEAFVSLLPRDFPAGLKFQLARESGAGLASKIYEDSAGREARLRRAKMDGNVIALWILIREDKEDDVALEAANLAMPSASTIRDRLDLAEVFSSHRQFEAAIPLYRAAAEDPAYAADARYQIARSHFLGEDYPAALETYQGIAKDFSGTGWERDAEYQKAACYWRMGDYRNAEKTYLHYIEAYGSRGMEEGAIRNLVDVYRVLGENEKARAWLDRALRRRLSAASRQVFLFTKAKVLYTQKRYAAALTIFQQLGRARLRPAAGGTIGEEVQYFQALCLSKTGNKTAAQAVWRKLARDEFSYYGQRSAEKLGGTVIKNPSNACSTERTAALKSVETDLLNLRRPLRTQIDPDADAVSELIFLKLWDEASFWLEESGKRLQPKTAAELAYMAGRYNRSIFYADRLPKTNSTLPLLYPIGFHQTICQAAGAYKTDPLWLHAIIWQESKYNPNARSGAAARGLMQFIPQTAAAVGAAIGMPKISVDELYDPAVSIRLGAHYWSSLLSQLKVPELALAAYNGGTANALRWKNKSPESPDDPELFVADIGFIETKRYVMSVFAARAAYESVLRK